MGSLETAKFGVVLGNEAVDLDSAVSAIAYAFLLQTQVLAPSFNWDLLRDSEGASLQKKEPVIPLLNVPRAQFHTKTEVAYYLRRVLPDIQPKQDLVFVGENLGQLS